MKYLLFIAIFIGICFWIYKKPSLEEIMSKTSYDLKEGTIATKDGTLYAEWGAKKKYSGDLRYYDLGTLKEAPFVTHEAILTTGDFSDPEKVFVSEIESGNMFWRSEGKSPEGSLVVLHLFPISLNVAKSLSSLEQGDSVTFVGREETDSLIEDDKGLFIGLRHNNHKFILVEDVTVE